MPVELEYTPLTDLDEVTQKLRELARTNPTEITDQDLFEGIVDVCASRGGERWRKWDEVHLLPDPRIDLFVGLDEPIEADPYFRAWIDIDPRDEQTEHYFVQKDGDNYQLHERGWNDSTGDDETSKEIPPESTSLRGRLIQLLLDGQFYTPEEPDEDDGSEEETTP